MRWSTAAWLLGLNAILQLPWALHGTFNPLLLLVPALTAFGLVVLFPFLEALGMSFYEFTIEMSEPEWNGIANFVAVLSDRSVISSFVTTMIFVGCATFFSILLGLGWALILNHPFPGRTVLRGLSLMPWVMPAIVAAFIWG